MVQARAFVCGVTPALGMRGATFLAFKTQNFFPQKIFGNLKMKLTNVLQKKNRSQKVFLFESLNESCVISKQRWQGGGTLSPSL